jgi:hypothetical protein
MLFYVLIAVGLRIVISSLFCLKCWYLSMELIGIVSQKTAIIVIVAMKHQISHSALHVC